MKYLLGCILIFLCGSTATVGVLTEQEDGLINTLHRVARSLESEFLHALQSHPEEKLKDKVNDLLAFSHLFAELRQCESFLHASHIQGLGRSLEIEFYNFCRKIASLSSCREVADEKSYLCDLLEAVHNFQAMIVSCCNSQPKSEVLSWHEQIEGYERFAKTFDLVLCNALDEVSKEIVEPQKPQAMNSLWDIGKNKFFIIGASVTASLATIITTIGGLKQLYNHALIAPSRTDIIQLCNTFTQQARELIASFIRAIALTPILSLSSQDFYDDVYTVFSGIDTQNLSGIRRRNIQKLLNSTNIYEFFYNLIKDIKGLDGDTKKSALECAQSWLQGGRTLEEIVKKVFLMVFFVKKNVNNAECNDPVPGKIVFWKEDVNDSKEDVNDSTVITNENSDSNPDSEENKKPIAYSLLVNDNFVFVPIWEEVEVVSNHYSNEGDYCLIFVCSRKDFSEFVNIVAKFGLPASIKAVGTFVQS